MKYVIDGKEYEVKIIKKNNKNTYLRVKEDLTIQVTTSYLTTKKYIKKLLDNNTNSIRRMINLRIEEKERNKKFYYLGNIYDIIIKEVDKLEIKENTIITKDDKQLLKWYNQQIKDIFTQRLKYNYNLFEENIPYPTLKIRTMKSRWGVCNRKNISVTLNSKLIEYDITKLDYVIIHELSHFVHFDHSKNFWNLVNKYCPEYKKIKKELKG